MSFPITLQYNASPKNQLTKDVTDIETLEGVLKDGTSIIDPVILVNTTGANVRSANYLYIPNFRRMYFIKNVIAQRTGLFAIECHVDVLSSFADEIRENNAIIRRNQNANNIRINDGVFTVRQDPHIVYRNFAGSASGGFTDNLEFVLAVAGS